uniref:Uncharacterized protein n=1 Tax=Chenopodium quinoa TaxID=63459 RepID=A0A803MKH0_CHEQI
MVNKIGEVELSVDSSANLFANSEDSGKKAESDVFLFTSGETRTLEKGQLEIDDSSKKGGGKGAKGRKRTQRDDDHSMKSDVLIYGEKRRECEPDQNNVETFNSEQEGGNKRRLVSVPVEKGNDEWRFTGVYGHPEDENKYKTSVLLESLKGSDDKPWLCGGDFNLMLHLGEKISGRSFCVEEAEILRNAMSYCHFEDLGFIGHSYTWTNNRGGEENIQERLDRFFAN